MAIIRPGSFSFPRKWNPTQVPTWPVEIDWTHVLAKDLNALFPDGGSRNLVEGTIGTPSGVGVVTSPYGPAYNFPNAGNVSYADTALLSPLGAITIAARVNIVDYTNGRTVVGKTSVNKPAPYEFRFDSPSGVPAFYRGNGTAFSQFNGGTAPTLGQMQSVAIQADAGPTFASYFLNGLLSASGAMGATTTASAGLPLLIGSRNDGVPQMSGQIQAVSIHSRVLSANEIAWLAAEPFIMLRPVVRRSFFVAAAAGGGAALASSVSATTTATGSLSTSIQLAASVSATTSTTATLAGGAAALAASVSATTTATAALTTSIQLASSVAASTSTAAALSTSINLAASAVVTTVATAALSTSIQLAANSAATTTATAVLTAPGGGISASVSTTTTAAGVLTTSIQLATSVVSTTTATANLTTGLGMANAFTLPNGKTQFFDANGKPLAGGKVYHYVPATTVPKDTYQDVAGATPNTNPVTLDSAGEAVIFGVGAYRQILNDSLGNLLWDQVTQTVSPATLGSVNLAGDTMTGTLVVPSLSDTGSQLVTATPTGDPITTLTSLNVQGTTVSTTVREFLGVFSLTANKRNGAAGSVTPSVALYSGVNGVTGTSDVWAIRNVALRTVGSGTYNMFGSEIDINNNNADYGNGAGAAGLAAPVTYGAVITGAGSFKNTAAMLISGPGTAIWNRGVCVTQNSVAQSAFQDLGNSFTSYDMQGTHTIGLDTSNGTMNNHAIRVADTHIIGTIVSNVNRSMLQHSTVNLFIGDVADTNIVAKTNFVPVTDNAYTVGANGNRWTAIWAVNGAIQTSDPSLKRNISPLSSLKADVIQKIVASINPISFQWIDGGKVPSVDEAPGLVQATEDVTISDLRVEIVNGAPVRKEHTRTETRPVVDMAPVVDKNGDTVMIESHDGTKHPLLHPVPRMVQGIVKTPAYKSTPGKRVHWGWDASEVKAAFDGVGLDFGGYVKDENGGQHLRPDQLIPVLWQAVKNLTARIETLEKGPVK